MSGMNVSSYSTLSSRKGSLGLFSGIESEDIIKKLTATTTNKITSQLQKKQVQLWKQSAYQELTTKMTGFYNSYFQYSGGNSNTILSEKFFNVSSITSSAPDYVNVSGDVSTASRIKIQDIQSLASAASFTSSHKVSNNAMSTGTILESWQNNDLAGAEIVFNIGGNSYTAKIDENFQFSSAATETSGETLTEAALTRQKQEITDALNRAITANTDIAGKVSATITDNGFVSFSTNDGRSIKIDTKTSSSLNNLGINSSAVSNGGTVTATAAYDGNHIYENCTLNGKLAGTSLTVTLDSISKTIEFKESEKDQYSTAEGLATYLDNALSNAYGEDRVFTELKDGKILFSTTKTDSEGTVSGNSSSIFTINYSNASGILGEKSALRILSGESNRTEYIKTLDQLSKDFTTPLTADSEGNYSINVNGKVFSFTGDTVLGDVVTKISADAEAGVSISYSSVTDTFSVTADDTGKQGKVDISDNDGSNLATVLFGTKGSDSDYNVSAGTDFIASMSFDNGNTYVDVQRSSNSFVIDDLTLNFTGKAEGTAQENISFTTSGNTDELFDKIKTFVEGYNEIVDWMNTKIGESLYGRSSDEDEVYLPLTDEQREEMSESEIKNWETKAQTGLLRNDSYLFQISVNLRKAMNQFSTNSGLSLDSIGISTSSDYTEGGKLYIDEDTLKSALSTNLSGVKSLFTDTEEGVAYKLQTVLQDAAVGNSSQQGLLVQVAGKAGISSSNSMMDDRISAITTQLTRLKSQLKTEEDRLWSKFTTLETYISNMNSQSSWLSSYFSDSSST